MNGELAQLIALTAYGNAYLAGVLDDPPELTATNSTFKYVGSVEFRSSSRGREASTVEWFALLKSEGTRSITVVLPRADDPNLAAFANGVPWRLRVVGVAQHDWTPSWEVRWPDAPDRKIWGVTYVGRGAVEDVAASVRVSSAREGLAASLMDAETFSQTHRLDWQKSFREARHLLDSEHPEPRHHDDVLPVDGYAVESRQLLAAASKARVFGGMGSWNDMYFEDEVSAAEYKRVSSDLYASVLVVSAAAANSFRASQMGGNYV